MFDTFINSFKLRNTYKVNTIIYSIKQLPIIKKILPESLYQNKALKIIGNIISIIMEILLIFLGKFIYIITMIFGVLSLYKTKQSDTFLHLLLFLSIIGAFLNTYMFNPTRDKYYAMFIMRMNAKEYTITNYLYSILKVIIGFMPFTIVFGLIANVNIFICILIPFYIASVKIIVGAYSLLEYEKKKIIINENKPVKYIWILTAFLLILAYGLPYIGIVINQTIFITIALIFIILAIYGIKYINKFNSYRELYKIMLTSGDINVTTNTQDIVKETVLKQIDIEENISSNKKGYAYFNDLFIKRHSKILSKSAKKITFVLTAIIIGVIFATYVNNDIKVQTNKLLMTCLPYFVFIMYIINRGQVVTQAMFMNCDHSMLTYSFYKTPKAILGLFKERLKSVIFINLIPALVLGIGLAIILYSTGGTDNNINYLIIFTSITAMSIFFSIHHLILYYLLQPYNVYSETKSSTFSIANALTYILCYSMLKIQIPTIYFGIVTIGFAIMYCIISLVLVYKLAPRTFRLRI